MSAPVRQRLQAEFVAVGDCPHSSLAAFDAAVVLCAEEVTVDGENGQRILAGLDALKKMAPGSPLIFLGTISHNQAFQKFVAAQKITTKIVYPTNRTQDSSRTQLQHLAVFLRQQPFRNLLIISHAYHIPRVRRYSKQSLVGQLFDFYPVGHVEDQAVQVATEIEKIITYAAKGDLPLWI